MNKKETIRLNKFLAQAGVASRRKADKLIELSEVKDKDLRKYVVKFREECLRNLGVNALHDHNN